MVEAIDQELPPLEYYDKLAIVISITNYFNLRENHNKTYLNDVASTREELF